MHRAALPVGERGSVILSELFSAVLLRYPSTRRTEVFSGNELGNIVRKDIPSALSAVVTNPAYVIKGSVG